MRVLQQAIRCALKRSEMFFGKRILAVVPARGGSKSIPGKNLQKIAGHSLLGHAALFTKKLKWLDASILSTDCEEIAKEGRKYNLAVPFMRPAALSTDKAPSVEMWKHAWIQAEESLQTKFDISILLEPTSPCRIVDDVEATVMTLINDRAPAVVTLSKTPAHYTPQKTLTISPSGNVSFYLGAKLGDKYSIRQRIPCYYHRNGICYAVTRQQLINRGKIFGSGVKGVVIRRNVVNIDDQYELKVADWLMGNTNHVKT